MKSGYWIQRANFSSEDFDRVGLNDAISAFKKADWLALEKERDLLQENGNEYCDPGIGYVPSDSNILHVALKTGNTFYIHYHYKKRGLILSRTKTASTFDIDWNDVPSHIELFFEENHNGLLEKMSG